MTPCRYPPAHYDWEAELDRLEADLDDGGADDGAPESGADAEKIN